jgi:hypothetical protein
MGFLRRLRGETRWPPPGPITEWPVGPLNMTIEARAAIFDPTSETVEVVGEGSYQGTLEQLAEGRTIDGARSQDHIALLIPEPTNPYDANAVRVVVATAKGDAATIGSLSRKDAIAFRRVIDRLAAEGRLLACRARITGGWDRGTGDRGNFGVRLTLRAPAALMEEMDETRVTRSD